MHDLLKNVKVTRVAAVQSAAGTDYTAAASVDMQGFEGCIFLLSMGTAAADNGIKVRQSADDSSYADLAGTSVLSDATETNIVVDVYKPTDRYLKPTAIRGTSTTIESIWAIQYGARKGPIDNDSTAAQAAETHISPAEGTA